MQARRLAAADMEHQRRYDEEMDHVDSNTPTLYAGRVLSAGPEQFAKIAPAIPPSSLHIRPGMGRQMSSVSNLIDAYSRNSPSTAAFGSSSIRNSTSSSNNNSAPTSPSSAQQSHPPRSLYYSQIITRRSSMQVSGSPRASTSELSPLLRERRPSAPEIHSPQTRVMAGSHGIQANATIAGSNLGSFIDMKRLRSKPAPPQQLHHHTSSSSMSGNNGSASTSAAVSGSAGDQHPSPAAPRSATAPKDQHDHPDSLVAPLTTISFDTQISSSQASSSRFQSTTNSTSTHDGSGFLMPLHSGPSADAQRQRRQQQASTSSNPLIAYDNALKDLGESYPRTQYTRDESSNSENYRHVDSSAPQQQYPNAGGRSRFDSSTSNSDSALSQQDTYTSSTALDSPQTPRKIRNSSLPMGTSPSLSSSPNPGRQSPSSSRRPLKPIVPTTSGFFASTSAQPYSMLSSQPSLPPAPGSKTNIDGQMYESILPTASSLRPHRQPSSEDIFVTSPPSTSSETLTSPEQGHSSSLASPTKPRKDRILSPSSPTPHNKLVRKVSKGHIRKDSGTSGHGQGSASTVHSRSLSLPRRASSRVSTPTGGTGSGSGSEQDDLHSTSSSHSHFFTQRPAWLDQDPNATFPPLPQTTAPLRTKPPQQHPLLQQQHTNRSFTSLRQLNPDTNLDQPIFAPASLPSTSTLLSSQVQSTAGPAPKRKPSFYRRKRSQTAIGVLDAQITDSNGFPMPSPMSEIVKNMPLHGRLSRDVLQPPALPPKRSTSAGGFLSSITRKLSHPSIKDPPPHHQESNLQVDTASLDYFGSTTVSGPPQPPDKQSRQTQVQSDNDNNSNSPKLGSSFAPRSWLHPFGHSDHSNKNDAKALPQLPPSSGNTSNGKAIYGDPFSASSTMSLPGFLHRSPRKDSLSSDKSEQSNGNRRRSPRSRTISHDGDSSDGHSSEVGMPQFPGYDIAPPVPELPFSMRNTAASPPSASTLPKASRRAPIALLRSPSLGHRGKKTVPDLDLSPTTPRAASFGNSGGTSDDLASPTRAGMLVINKANESLDSARRSGLNAALLGATGSSDTPPPNILGSVAAMDKIAAIENDIKEARFMALMDKSERAERGVIKLSLASSAAREAGIA